MAQLVARLVRNEKVGGSNPPSSTTGRHPIRMSVFCMPGRCCGGALLWRRWCSGRRRARPLCVPVGGGLPACCCLLPHGCSGRRRARPPARSPHASLAARSGRSRSPPVPSGPSGTLHTSGAWSLMCGWAHRLAALPGPAAAHGHRSLALPPPTGTAVWLFGPSDTLHTGGTWCAVVSTGSASTLYAVQSSPCSGCWWPKRYKVRPARTKLAKTGHFERAGRVLYCTCNEEGCAGRFLYRKRGRMARAGRILSRPPAL